MILNFPNRRSGSLAIPQTGDDSISVPNTLQPIIELPGTMAETVSGSDFIAHSEPILADTHIHNVIRTQPASSATALIGITRLKAGLWRLIIHATAFGSFIPATQLTKVQLIDPSAVTATDLVDLSFIANVPTKDFNDFLFNPPNDGWEIALQQGITAAGQTIFCNVTVIANRLG